MCNDSRPTENYLTLAAPQKKLNEIIDELNAYVNSPNLNLERLEHLESEASRLERFGFYVDSKKILGMIASLKSDYESVKSNYGAAIRGSGNEYSVVVSYITSLVNVHHYVEALAEIEKVIDYHKDDVGLLDLALTASFQSFDRKALEKYIALMGNRVPRKKESLSLMLESQDRLLEPVYGTVGEEYLHAFSDRIADISDKLFQDGFNSRTMRQTPVDGYVYVSFMIDGELEDAISAETCMHNYLASLPYSAFDDFFITSCAQYERLAS